MRSYKETLEELSSKGIKALGGDFYEYDDFPLSKEFKNFHRYCQDYLDRDDLEFKINPARLYYNTNTNENGFAYVKEGYSLVEIYKGTIFALHNFYSQKKELFNKESLLDYEKLIQRSGVDSSYFLFQIVTLFFLYHEVGHLIQRSKGAIDYQEFIIAECEGNDIIERHVKEHDADWFAASQIAFHIHDLVKRLEPKNEPESKAMLADVTAMALAGIYTHFIRWSKGYPKIYFEEHCHPHPSVRLCYTIIYLLDTLTANHPFQLNQEQVLKNAIRISEALMMEGDTNVIENYSKELFSEIKQVEDYIKKIRQDAESFAYLSQKILAK